MSSTEPEPEHDAESAGPLIAGRYRLEDDAPIGSGGAGEVWPAIDTTLRRVVALKKIQLDGVSEGSAGEAAQRTQTIASLSHPNIVTIHDVITDGDQRWLVLDYVPSRGADALLATQGPFPLHLAATIGSQLAEALTAAHAHGVVHRDVTPANVLIDTNWNAKLTNFDISRIAIDPQRTTNTIGTPDFMAPETARGESASTATDVYGLGATVWALVEGVPPFHQPGPDNPMRLMHRIATSQPTYPVKAGPLTTALTNMTGSDPTRRPSAADARDMFAAAAQAIATGSSAQPIPTNLTAPFGGGQPGVPPAPASTAPGKGGGRRKFAVIISAAALLLIAAIVGTVLVVKHVSHSATGDKYLPDPETVDACALAKIPDYALFGTVAYRPDISFSACFVDVDLAGGGSAAIDMEMLSPQDIDGSLEQRGDLQIVTSPQVAANQCYREMVLPSRNYLMVWTTITGNQMDPCVLSGVGVDAVVEQLHTRGPHSDGGQRAPQLVTSEQGL